MKKNIYFFIGILFLMAACGNKNTTNTQANNEINVKPNPIKISFTPKNQSTWKTGDAIELNIELQEAIKADSCQIYLDNRLIARLGKLPIHYTLNTNHLSVGIKNIKVVLNDPTHQTNITTLTLNSDLTPKKQSYKVIKTYPHDNKAYTQGLFFNQGVLYEGTGLVKESTLRKVKFETGTVQQNLALPEQVFGEGITLYKDKIYQLTWQDRKAFMYDKENFHLIREFDYPTEGWGITTWGDTLIRSDGSSTLYFINPENFEEIKHIQVHDNVGPVIKLNELELINGEIWANIYETDKIARIDPLTGKVLAYIDFTGLLSQQDRTEQTDVLNGIAYDPNTKRIWVTGKRWSKLFEIKVSEK